MTKKTNHLSAPEIGVVLQMALAKRQRRSRMEPNYVRSANLYGFALDKEITLLGRIIDSGALVRG